MENKFWNKHILSGPQAVDHPLIEAVQPRNENPRLWVRFLDELLSEFLQSLLDDPLHVVVLVRSVHPLQLLDAPVDQRTDEVGEGEDWETQQQTKVT